MSRLLDDEDEKIQWAMSRLNEFAVLERKAWLGGSCNSNHAAASGISSSGSGGCSYRTSMARATSVADTLHQLYSTASLSNRRRNQLLMQQQKEINKHVVMSTTANNMGLVSTTSTTTNAITSNTTASAVGTPADAFASLSSIRNVVAVMQGRLDLSSNYMLTVVVIILKIF